MTAPGEFAPITALLQQLRLAAGNPSFNEVVQRVAAVRAARGMPGPLQRPARSTVYDCFKPGRQRYDMPLVIDIVRALGADDDATRDAERLCLDLFQRAEGSRIVGARTALADPPDRFVGRRDELALLTSGATDGPSVFVIHGMAGAGKTELALEAARRLVGSGRAAGVVWVDLRAHASEQPVADASAAFDAVVRALDGVPYRLPEASDERTAAYSRLLAERRVVLILDDAASTEQLEPLLPDDPTVPVFVTSRRSLDCSPPARGIELGVLSTDDAVTLLAGAGESTDDDRRTETPTRESTSDLAGLAETVGNLPLALRIVAGRLERRPDWAVSDHVAALVGWTGEPRLDEVVRTAFDASYRSLSDDGRRLGDALGEGRARLHHGQSMIRLGRYDDAAASLAQAELLVADHPRALIGAKNAIAVLAYQQGELRTALDAMREGADLSEAIGEVRDSSVAHSNVAVILRRLDDLDGAEAELMLARDLAEASGDVRCLAIALSNLSDVRRGRGDAAAALADAQHSLELCEQHEFVSSGAIARLSLGAALAALGHHREGVDYLRSAVDIADRISDLDTSAQGWNLLGETYLASRRLDDAAEAFERALEFSGRLGDEFETARARSGAETVVAARRQQAAPAGSTRPEIR